jgi:hypothetical protein
MPDTVVSDAAVFPQDEGLPNISDGSETWGSAGWLSLLAHASAHGPFIHDGLTFAGHDATNDTVDVTSGQAFVSLSGQSVSVQSALGGSSAPSYDTTLTDAAAIGVVLPTTVSGLSVSDTSLNPVWIAYATDGAVTNVAAGDVYLRHGSGETAPPHPNLKLGEANPDDSTQDFRAGYDNPPDREGWRVDPTGIVSGTGSASVTYPLSGRYDRVRLVADFWTESSNNISLSLRVNGVSTADYEVLESGSNQRTGLSSWNDIADMRPSTSSLAEQNGRAVFDISGTWDSSNPFCHCQEHSSSIYDTGGGTDSFHFGELGAPGSPPLTDLDVFTAGGETGWGHEIRCFGTHLGDDYPL